MVVLYSSEVENNYNFDNLPISAKQQIASYLQECNYWSMDDDSDRKAFLTEFVHSSLALIILQN